MKNERVFSSLSENKTNEFFKVTITLLEKLKVEILLCGHES